MTELKNNMQDKNKKFEFTQRCVSKFITMLLETRQNLKKNISENKDTISSQVLLNQTNRCVRTLAELQKTMRDYNLR